MGKLVTLNLEYQPYIFQPPVPQGQLYQDACKNDKATIDSWEGTWLKNIKSNHEKFGPFKDRGLGLLHNKAQQLPIIVAGSGPSLKLNGHLLKDRPQGMKLISCLHNFHFMEDNEAGVDYYVTLDAGPVTIEEVTEGGSKSEEEYWKITNNRTLIAYIGTHPMLLEKWQGPILFYNAPVPSETFSKAVNDIEKFHTFVSNGGNVLGACMYIAKGFLGCPTTIFVGADFSFSNREKTQFHAWDSKYDANIGNYITVIDIFGCPVKTWNSYSNFKKWFDYVTLKLPGIYINSTEGGTFGAYRDGNLFSIKQMDLKDTLDMFSLSRHTKDQSENPEVEELKLLI